MTRPEILESSLGFLGPQALCFVRAELFQAGEKLFGKCCSVFHSQAQGVFHNFCKIRHDSNILSRFYPLAHGE